MLFDSADGLGMFIFGASSSRLCRRAFVLHVAYSFRRCLVQSRAGDGKLQERARAACEGALRRQIDL
jgi:hypothetical protein